MPQIAVINVILGKNSFVFQRKHGGSTCHYQHSSTGWCKTQGTKSCDSPGGTRHNKKKKHLHTSVLSDHFVKGIEPAVKLALFRGSIRFELFQLTASLWNIVLVDIVAQKVRFFRFAFSINKLTFM